MNYQYQGFIPENIAPKGAKQIGVYDADGNRVGTIPLRSLAPVVGEKLFSFGLVSDIHVAGTPQTYARPEEHFEQALAFFEEQGCLFCAHAGDMTNIGFWYNATDTEIYTTQFAEYKRICDLFPNLPVYGTTGNHESYNKPITENLAELEAYTGWGLHHTHLQGNDLFIFVGHPASSPTMDAEGFAWLKNLLETNTDKRCHVFTHFFVADDSGNTKSVYTCRFGNYEADFKAIMAAHGKAIHYHGHSHIKFVAQEIDDTTNYTDKNGFPSVHIPGLVASRNVVKQEDGTYEMVTDHASSQGYIVDVYADCVVYNGFEFNGSKPIPTGIFKIVTA